MESGVFCSFVKNSENALALCKILLFFVYFHGSILWRYLAHFLAQARKIKEIHPQNNYLDFAKWNLLALLFKYLLHFLIFWEMKLFSTSSKKIHPEKIFHFLGKWNFLTLILKSVLYFKDASLANNFIRNKIRNLNAVNDRRVLYKTVTNETF